ncbi:uncharacterized protein M6B38_163530 [Iris pallida]|uniref:Uncharacterized protein n=1 Tax=Iris pallida TaxID=29817 RepID=A0AAX6EZ20_IRIPA|nr:uncharacterized protein M6B38_163530 [Iris pallida]
MSAAVSSPPPMKPSCPLPLSPCRFSRDRLRRHRTTLPVRPPNEPQRRRRAKPSVPPRVSGEAAVILVRRQHRRLYPMLRPPP